VLISPLKAFLTQKAIEMALPLGHGFAELSFLQQFITHIPPFQLSQAIIFALLIGLLTKVMQAMK